MTPETGLGDIGVTRSEVKKVMQVKQVGKVKKLKRVPCFSLWLQIQISEASE